MPPHLSMHAPAAARHRPGSERWTFQNKEVKLPEGVKWDTFFFEDTVELLSAPQRLGTVVKAWHDINEPDDNWADVQLCTPGDVVTADLFYKFQRTGQPPKHFCLFLPSSPEYRPVLVHESELRLVDRAHTFGDTVKWSLSDSLSGTVLALETEVEIRHCFPKMDLDPVDYVDQVIRVPDTELALANEWHKGDFVIWKNCWMGIVEDVENTVAVRLDNGSVVIPEKMDLLRIPLYRNDTEDRTLDDEEEGEHSKEKEKDMEKEETEETEEKQKEKEKEKEKGADDGGPTEAILSNLGSSGLRIPPRPITSRSIPVPEVVSPGQLVTTTKANLRRGTWVIGAYDPRISPTGVVVQVNTISLGINWLSQNIMVSGRFVPVPSPPLRMEEEDLVHLTRLKKSSRGTKNVDGSPFDLSRETHSEYDLQVGDRVRFHDIDKAVEKYAGKVRKINRRDTSGYDVNTFLVIGMKSRIRVLWQDATETVEEAKNVVPYSNVDDHEVWPGEIVVVRPESGDVTVLGAPRLSNDELEKTELFKPQRVGVVQKVRAKERVAAVKWFQNPRVEMLNSMLMPGSRTGTLAEDTEETSLYDVVAHAAVSIRRGDIVLIVPESQSENPNSSATTQPINIPNREGSDTNEALERRRERWAEEVSRRWRENMTDLEETLLLNFQEVLSGNMNAVPHPDLGTFIRSLANLLDEDPEVDALINERWDPADEFSDMSIDWVGEVVDLGTDGLLTVRLNALKVPRDIRIPLERAQMVLSGDDLDLNEEIVSDEEWEDDEMEEEVWYEDGERVDSDGGEWATDEDGEVEDDMPPPLVPVSREHDFDEEMDDGSSMPELVDVVQDGDHMEEDSENAAPAATSSDSKLSDQGSTKPESKLPEATPSVSETISLPPSHPPRFEILDTPPPSDHAFLNSPATAPNSTFLRRIAREHAILSTSLPDGIFIRAFESRLDLLRVLIIGPLNTPYELAPFVFDFYFPPSFPASPPVAHFHSWTGGVGRVNPNLYEEGKVCLSLLGTWHAERRSEGWDEGRSTVLQVVVSLRGLVLVREPYFNEAGYNVYIGTPEAALNSALYSEKAYILARGFVKHVLKNPVGRMEDVINWLYLPGSDGGPELLKEVVEKAREVVVRSEGGGVDLGSEGVGRITEGALVLLRRFTAWLEGFLERVEKDAGVTVL
ncbi:hypothetical protein RUND412_010833 [Rhizina undulata]